MYKIKFKDGSELLNILDFVEWSTDTSFFFCNHGDKAKSYVPKDAVMFILSED